MLSWSEKPPEAPGYYWWKLKMEPGHKGEVMWFDEPYVVRTGHARPQEVAGMGGFWAGPIPEPEAKS